VGSLIWLAVVFFALVADVLLMGLLEG
jgi:hypothetical protein